MKELPQPGPGDRLESWKEIGRYLRRDVRTVQRWERLKGLPVRRLPGGDMARVYAIKPELDAWWHSGELELHETAPTPSIAVLPFADFSAERESGHFGDGLADDIIDALTHVGRSVRAHATLRRCDRRMRNVLPVIESQPPNARSSGLAVW